MSEISLHSLLETLLFPNLRIGESYLKCKLNLKCVRSQTHLITCCVHVEYVFDDFMLISINRICFFSQDRINWNDYESFDENHIKNFICACRKFIY